MPSPQARTTSCHADAPFLLVGCSHSTFELHSRFRQAAGSRRATLLQLRLPRLRESSCGMLLISTGCSKICRTPFPRVHGAPTTLSNVLEMSVANTLDNPMCWRCLSSIAKEVKCSSMLSDQKCFDEADRRPDWGDIVSRRLIFMLNLSCPRRGLSRQNH